MASITNDTGGHRRLVFIAPDGVRRSIRLGRVSQCYAEGVRFLVEQLLAARQADASLETICKIEKDLAQSLNQKQKG